MWEVSLRRYKAAALQVKHKIDKYMSKMHVRIPNSSLGVLVSLLAVTALWSFISHATSQVSPLLLPHSGSVDWLVPSRLLSCMDAVRSLRSGMLGRRRRFPSSSCSWRNFLRRNSWENFSRGDCTLLCRLRNSWCLDSLSVVFLGPTKTDLFRLTRWRAAAETRCRSCTPRGEGHGGEMESVWFFFFPTAESCQQRSSCYASCSAAKRDRLEDMSAFHRPRWSVLSVEGEDERWQKMES